MSLQFYFGGSGAGKSRRLYDEITIRSLSETETDFLIIVPDQFTMQTQKELVENENGRGGIRNIDVLSFGRLSHRIFEEVGGNEKPVLDDTGKSLILRKVAAEVEGKLTVIGKNLQKQGYIHEVKSVISEFMQYGIGEKELEALIDYSGQNKRSALQYKLTDLHILYRAFTDYINGQFITTEETLDLLCSALGKSALIKRSVIVFDGFTGFTPIQNKVILELMKTAREVIVTVIMDGEEEPFKEEGEQKLFHLSKKTAGKLHKIALENGIERKPDVYLKENPVPRFADNPEMAHLEQYLFRYPVKAYEKENEKLRILEAGSPKEEVRQTAALIKELVRTEGYAYRDIAVVTGDLNAYAPHVDSEFEKFGIPCFVDRTRGIVLNPFIEYIRSALALVIRDFSYETVFHFLRSGLADVTEVPEASEEREVSGASEEAEVPEAAKAQVSSEELVDRLENYVLSLGIRGKSSYSRMFVRMPWNMEAEELEQLNRVRERMTEQLAPLLSPMKTVREQVLALYEFIEKNQIQKKLVRYENLFLMEGEPAKAKEYGQIYRLVMELLNQIIGLLGDEPMELKEFADILDAGFAEIQVGTIPQNVDRVVVGDMERTRLNQVKVLFFVGVNDGNIPKSSGKGGIISDIDREFLKETEFELSPTPRQQMYIQQLYLYMNMTKPTEKLFLSFAKTGNDGKALRPSYLIGTCKKLFPKLLVEKAENGRWETGLSARQDGVDVFVTNLRRFADDRLSNTEQKRFFTLFALFLEEEGFRETTERLTDTAFLSYKAKPLARAVAKAMYGQVLENSVSRLETYAACAYAHFLQYGLLLKEREGYSFERSDLGTVFHGVLEVFSQKLEEGGYSFLDFPENIGRQYVEEAIESFAAGYGETVLFASARNTYMISRIRRVMLRTVFSLQEQLKKGLFTPDKFEMSFSRMEDISSLNIALSEEEKMKLKGRIDRVDTYEEAENVYVKVIDYKSGNKQFDLVALYYGLQLQLVVYLNAAMEQQKKAHPDKQIIPAAILYYHVSDPLVTLEKEIPPEEINEKILASLKMTGVVNGEEKIVNLLDRTFDTKSDVIPVERKKDGSLSARSSVMSGEELQELSRFVNQKIYQIGTRILHGDIAVNPYEKGQADACTYCAYKSVCGFDGKIPGYRKRKLDGMTKEEAFENIEEAIAKKTADDRNDG